VMVMKEEYTHRKSSTPVLVGSAIGAGIAFLIAPSCASTETWS